MSAHGIIVLQFTRRRIRTESRNVISSSQSSLSASFNAHQYRLALTLAVDPLVSPSRSQAQDGPSLNNPTSHSYETESVTTCLPPPPTPHA